jgi:serine/threonine-protein kinase
MFGPYRLETLLGRGGMGEVYQASDTRKAERKVALKRLPAGLSDDAEYRARFEREAQLTSQMREPHIIPIHDYGVIDGQLFLDMRLVEGTDLAAVLAGGTALPPRRAVNIITQIAAALDAAHDAGLVHRDVKPSNILLVTPADSTGDEFAYLIDFGIARPIAGDGRITAKNLPLGGSAAYMAPERFTEPDGGDQRVDIYALGCVLYELLAGHPPFAGADTANFMGAHLSTPPPPLESLPADLATIFNGIIARALAKSPAHRYPRAGHLAAAARAAAYGTTEPNPPEPPGPPTGPHPAQPSPPTPPLGGGHITTPPAPTGRHWSGRTWALAASATGLVAIALAALFIASHPPAPTPMPAAARAVQRGPQLYQAPLDGTSHGFTDLVGNPTNPTTESVTFTPGKLELAALTPDGNPRTDLQLDNSVVNYIGDLDISVQPGSAVLFCWSLRWAVPGKLAWEMCVDTNSQFAQFDVWNGTNHVPISPRVEIPALQTGRTVPITVVVRDTHLTLYIDGNQSADIENNQVPPAHTFPGLDVYATDRPGTVTIHALSLYALPTA